MAPRFIDVWFLRTAPITVRREFLAARHALRTIMHQ
jgi:hypothetical protein